MDRSKQLRVREELLEAFKALDAQESCEGDEIMIRSLIEVTMFGRAYLFSDRGLKSVINDMDSFKMKDLLSLMMACSKASAEEIMVGVQEMIDGDNDGEEGGCHDAE